VSSVADLWSYRVSVLREAEDAITGDRNNSYGPPTQDFARTAGVLNALGYSAPNGPLQPHDVAIMIAAVKLSRLMWSPDKKDSWIDLAGYAACGFECVVENRNNSYAANRAEGCQCPECQDGHA